MIVTIIFFSIRYTITKYKTVFITIVYEISVDILREINCTSCISFVIIFHICLLLLGQVRVMHDGRKSRLNRSVSINTRFCLLQNYMLVVVATIKIHKRRSTNVCILHIVRHTARLKLKLMDL